MVPKADPTCGGWGPQANPQVPTQKGLIAMVVIVAFFLRSSGN